MPKQINEQKKKSNRKAIDAYHNKVMAAIHIARSWSSDNTELQEFLDHSSDLLSEPVDFKEFRETLVAALEQGTKAGLYQNYGDSQMKVKIIARHWVSEPRTRYYANLINSRLRCKADEMVEPISLRELEQWYQYYLYKQGRADQGFGNGPVFPTWARTPNAKTFYDEIDALLY